MPLPFQGLVNGWVKVNSQHVVIKKNNNEEANPRAKISIKTEERNAGQISAGNSSQRSRNDFETSKTRRFNMRQRRNKLERSVSLSDLLRDMASKKNDQKEKVTVDKNHDSSKNKFHMLSNQMKNGTEIENSNEACNFVSGILDQDVPPSPPQYLTSKQANYNRKSCVQNDFEDISPRMTNSLPEQQRRLVENTSVASRPSIFSLTEFTDTIPIISSRSTPPLHPMGDDRSRKSKQSNYPIRCDDSRTSNPTNRCDDSRTSRQSNPMQEFFKNFPGKRCSSCEELEARLVAMHADIEYLRTEAVRREYVCYECQNKELKRKEELSRLCDASKRIADISEQHMVDLEKTPKELWKWQEDLQFQLTNFAMIAKDLNEELTLRNQEAIKLEQEFNEVKAQRDELAVEVESLRTNNSHCEEELADLRTMKKTLHHYEIKDLLITNKALEQREAIVRKLTDELSKALELLELEREQKRQRRQIFSPSRVSNSTLQKNEAAESTSVRDKKAVTDTRIDQNLMTVKSLEDTIQQLRTEAKISEKTYREKIKALERQLHDESKE